ncbi:MAG: response regulator [Gammaproteobacteria bacterium]|nr:response regulator [Gammaproteobacteria bacterium]
MDELSHTNARILAVEDNPRYSALLLEALEESGYREIQLAETAEAAHEKLARQYFDVIITDMRLGEDREGGFLVLNEIKARNITSIVIILTANDTVVDCRRAFREGAWDYISKNMRGDVLAILNESILDALIYAEQWGNRQDEMWIQNNKKKLLEQYPGQYIAVINNSVIDADSNRQALQQRIRARKLPLLLPVIREMATETLEQLPVAELIQREESECLEFKSTLQCNVKDGNKNEAVVLSVLKTIAAFMNTSGGLLLIGVEDDGKVFGLEADIALLGKRKDLDGFGQKLVSLIVERIGAAFSPLVKIRFEKAENKDLCVLEVSKAKSPAFVQARNKSGERQKYFFIRAGNTTRALDVEEMFQYIQMKVKVVF